MQLLRTTLACAIAITATTSPARSQPATTASEPEPEPEPEPDEVIMVEGRWPGISLIDPARTPRAITVHQIAPAAGVAVLGDVLAEVPGIAVQRTGPGQGAPIIRGLLGSAVLLLVDGMRVNNALFRPAPNQYNALIDPWSAERVEVVRGPGSTAFGSDAIGGVIDMITALPRFDGETWQRRTTVVMAAASADRSIATRAAIATGRRGSGLSLGVTVQDHDDLRLGGGAIASPSAYRSLAADVAAHVERGRHATSAWLQLVEQPALSRTDELNAGFGQTEPGAEVYRYQPSRRQFAHLRHLIRQPFARIDGLELHVAWQRIDDDRQIRDTGATEELIESAHDDGLGVTARASATAAGAQLIAGADAWFDRVRCRRWIRVVASGAVSPTTCRFADGGTMRQLGGYGEARRELGGRLSVRAGLRAGLAAVHVPARGEAPGAEVSTIDWAGELGAELSVVDGVSLVANLGRGFRIPNINDLSGLGPRGGGRYQIPAADLASERAIGGDVGVRVHRAAIDAEVYGFGLAYRGRIDVVPTGEMTADGLTIVASDNIASVQLAGVEASLRARPTTALELVADLTWTHGVQRFDTEAGEPADRVPPPRGRLWSRWHTARGLVVEAGVAFAAAQDRLSARDQGDPRIDPDGTPAFATLHLGAAITIRSVDLLLRLDNLLDRRYREHASGVDAPGFDAGLMVRWTGE